MVLERVTERHLLLSHLSLKYIKGKLLSFFSDSLSALHEFVSGKQGHFITTILDILSSINVESKVIFCLVPSHVGSVRMSSQILQQRLH